MSYIITQGAKESRPFGAQAKGLVVFTEEGWFSVQIMQPERPRFARNNLKTGTCEEVQAAFTGYIAYFGKYTIDLNTSIIQLEPVGALFPNWLDNTQIRSVNVSGETLRLSTAPVDTPRGPVTAQLTWQKFC